MYLLFLRLYLKSFTCVIVSNNRYRYFFKFNNLMVYYLFYPRPITFFKNFVKRYKVAEQKVDDKIDKDKLKYKNPQEKKCKSKEKFKLKKQQPKFEKQKNKNQKLFIGFQNKKTKRVK